jgi:hypothetical protein
MPLKVREVPIAAWANPGIDALHEPFGFTFGTFPEALLSRNSIIALGKLLL